MVSERLFEADGMKTIAAFVCGMCASLREDAASEDDGRPAPKPKFVH
jgi:hypothetical protein